MMRRLALPVALVPAMLAGCASAPETAGTLAELRSRSPDVQEVAVDQGLERAMEGYRRFLEETPETPMTPEAMRRLADLQVEKEFGLRAGDGKPREMAAPDRAQDVGAAPAERRAAAAPGNPEPVESEQDFERRTTAAHGFAAGGEGPAPAVPAGEPAPSGPLEAIAIYDRLLAEYPGYEHNDKVLYQKARAYDELGRTDEAMETMERLIREYSYSGHYDEVQFRRAEYFFTRRQFRDAEAAYASVTSLGPDSSYYELARYKLGWTLYKQDFYEDALHQFMALLDHKVEIGYDFDQTESEDDERRVADTYRVISLSFTNLGGPEVVQEYFTGFGHRGYEDRIYSNLGEHYLAKLRYDDATRTYRSFVEQYPFHRSSPHFSMRVVEIFTQGGFPKLVLESKKDFAGRYGLNAEYWHHFDPAESPEVIGFLKANLKDLANHYHAQYQDAALAQEKPANYAEALHWYGAYLESFPADAESPVINYQLADLLLENEDFGEAARQYERTAYEYPAHERSDAAGYAAIFAHRQALGRAPEDQRELARRETVASSIRFADAFPEHDQAAAVLGAAADDLHGMHEYPQAVTTARRIIDSYPGADPAIRRSAWLVAGHGSFELGEYAQAEQAYVEVLAATPADDGSRAALADNLAASIYKQGELASTAGDDRSAADHFLRIRAAAPTSTIRAAAEYDAGAALIRLQDWTAAASVLEAFRSGYPDHELSKDATRQLAFVYREGGQLTRAAGEYDRVAAESTDPALRAEALLVAGDLYEQSRAAEQALDAYSRYVAEFPAPVEMNIEIRFKVAGLRKAAYDEAGYFRELEDLVRVDAGAGDARTARTRTLAARSALVLAERLYGQFASVRLLQPFESSLQVKQGLMDQTIAALGGLVDYGIAEVTAAATFYIAETYLEFSRALTESQRPADLEPAELAEYELALEEEAFPFEEQAIEVHEKNLELLRAGVFNAWTGKSLDQLAGLVPGRYARTEISVGFLGSIETYAYRSPASLVPPVAAGEAGASAPQQAMLAPPAADAAPAAGAGTPDGEVTHVEP
jgi:tetratricopeptide (TPR) repeat protein